MTKNSNPISYYEILNTTKNANDEEIKKAYLKLAKKYHPDQNLGNISAATKRFHKVVEAYNAIKTKEKRVLYNQKLKSNNAYNANDNTIFTKLGDWIWTQNKKRQK